MDASTQTIPPPPRRHSDSSVNVGDGERWLSLLGGGSSPSPQCAAR